MLQEFNNSLVKGKNVCGVIYIFQHPEIVGSLDSKAELPVVHFITMSTDIVFVVFVTFKCRTENKIIYIIYLYT